MHELSIAQSILDIARQEMQKAKTFTVKELELEIGELAGIELESLQFALKALTADSELEKMQIVIQRPEGLALCENCKTTYKPGSYIAQCPTCLGYNCKIVSGKELRVKSIVI